MSNKKGVWVIVLLLIGGVLLFNSVKATDCRFTMTLYDPNNVAVDSCHSDYVNESGVIGTCSVGYQKCVVTGMYYIEITDNCTNTDETRDFYMCDATPPSIKSSTYFSATANNVSNFFNTAWRVYDKGLLLYLPFEKLDGTTVYDESPYSHSAKAINGPTLTNGYSFTGYALHFDGSDDYVNVSSVNPTTAITVAAWVKSDSATGYPAYEQMVSKYNAFILGDKSTADGEVCFLIYNTSGVWNYGNCYNVTTPNKWHFFVGTYDSSTQNKSLYVDGMLRDSVKATGNINSDNGPIHIGHREYDDIGTNHFQGSIDEVRIYNRSLNKTEIIDLYLSGLIRHDIEYSTTSMGDYYSSSGLYDDFSGVLTDNWSSSGNTEVTWGNAGEILKSEAGTSKGFGYLKHKTYNISGKDVLIEFDIKYTGAKRGGIIFRNKTCEISPTGTGWGNTIIGEVGNVTLYNTTYYYNRTVNFTHAYSNPIVVAYIMTRNNNESLEVRVEPINGSFSQSAKFFLMKPENSGYINEPENIGYIVMEIGRHVLPDGTVVEAGKSILTSSHNGTAGDSYSGQVITFTEPFNKTPALLHTLDSNYNKNFSTSTVYFVNRSEFKAEIELAETNSNNRSEYLGWIAIEANVTGINNGVKFETGTVDDGSNDGVDDSPQDIAFSQSFTGAPVVIVKGNSGNGLEGYWARSAGTLNKTMHKVYAEEDQVTDTERSHTDETFSYWAFQNATTIMALTRGINTGKWQHVHLYIWGRNKSNVHSSMSVGVNSYFSEKSVNGSFPDDKFGFYSPYESGYYEVDNLKIVNLAPGIEKNVSEAKDIIGPGTPTDVDVTASALGTNRVAWTAPDDYATTYIFYMRDYDSQDNAANYINNPSFEDMNVTPWNAVGSSTLSVTSNYFYDGDWSLNVSASAAGGGVSQQIEHYDYAVGKDIMFYCMARATSSLGVEVSAKNVSGNSQSYTLGTTWTRISFSGTVNSDAGGIEIIINSTAAGDFFIDDCYFQQVFQESVRTGLKDYYVNETSGGVGGDDSGWISNTYYDDSGLYCFHSYCYNVKARDNALNIGSTSDDVCNYPIPDGVCTYGNGSLGYCLDDSNDLCYYENGGTTGCPSTPCYNPGTIMGGYCWYDNDTVVNRSNDCSVNGCTGLGKVSEPSCTEGNITNTYADCWYGTTCNYSSTDPCQADTDGWDMHGGTTLCSAGDTECCPSQGTYADGVNCSKNGIVGTSHDRDDAEAYCEATATGCTRYNWSSVESKCCGDDTNENFTEAKFEGGACVNGTWHSNHCTDGILDGDETAIDSGGPWCEDAPSTSVTLNSSYGTNKTDENLTLHYSLTDEDYDEVFPVIDWRVNDKSIAVLNLPFQVNDSSIARDFSIYGNNGTVYGAEWSKYGFIGGAYKFDGINDYINVSSDTSLNITKNITIMLWFYPENVSSTSQRLVSKDGVSANDNHYYIVISSSNMITAGFNNGSWVQISGDLLKNNTWYFVAAERKGDNISLYVNGALVNTTTFAGDIGAGSINPNIFIGVKDGGTQAFKGEIDEVRIFNRSLSDEQIYRIYKDELNHRFNLVLNMIFNENTTYNATGWVQDMSRFNNKGRLGDGVADWAPVWNSTGVIGGSYFFDGSNDYINVSNSDSLNITKNITISIWFNANDGGYLLSKRGTYMINISLPYVYAILNNGTLVSVSSTISYNTWYNIVMTYNGSVFALYKNGSLVSSKAVAGDIVATQNNLLIGSYNGASLFFNGIIDDVKIFNASLSSEEVENLYKEGLNKRTRTLVSNETVKGENWTARVWGSDNKQLSSGVLSNEVSIANSKPLLTSISASENPIKPGNTQTITPSGQNDINKDDLYLYCCNDTANTCTPSSSLNLCSEGSFSYPYSTMKCTFSVPSVSGTLYVRCRTYDGDAYSDTTASTSFTIDTSAPLVNITWNKNYIRGTVNFNATVSDSSGLKDNSCYAALNNSAPSWELAQDNFSDGDLSGLCNRTYDTSSLTDGALYSINFKVNDSADNLGSDSKDVYVCNELDSANCGDACVDAGYHYNGTGYDNFKFEAGNPNCCGDDASEYYINTNIQGTYYDGCCDNSGDCVDETGTCRDNSPETGALCDDGIDNDCDGYIDSADNGCCPVIQGNLFAVKNATANCTKIDTDGDIAIKGDFVESCTDLPGNDDFVVRAGSTVLMWINHSSCRVCLKGSLYKDQTSISPGTNEFLIKNGTTNYVVKIDSNGNLYTTGNLGYHCSI